MVIEDIVSLSLNDNAGVSRPATNSPPSAAPKPAAHFEHVETVDLHRSKSDDSLYSLLTASTKSTTIAHASSLTRLRHRDLAPVADGLSDVASTGSRCLSRQTSTDSSGATIPILSVLDVIPSSFDDIYPPEVLLLFPPQPPHHSYPYHSRHAWSSSSSNHVSDEGLFSSFGIADLYLRRPSFTRRDLIDWELNDLRSLCIVAELKPDWLPDAPTPTASNRQLLAQAVPLLREENFRLILLPLSADDATIIDTLVNSDLYVEFGFSMNHRARLARETIDICLRSRHDKSGLTKPEWRRLIDNYLLALGCEAQGRVDFKKAVMNRALRNREQQLAKGRGNLLKRVLLNRATSSTGVLPSRASGPVTATAALKTKMTPSSLSASTSSSPSLQAATAFLSRTTKSTTEFFQNLGPKASLSSSPETVAASSSSQQIPQHVIIPNFSSTATSSPPANSSILVSRAEQKLIWREVQILLYTRLGLDWEPTELAF
ncbi:hypothetical protein V1517DRAFT_308221 [Lipomyces orientalis]|uniref:Uncharacterized protein n=1 Tax=Lipomyces orientalis TaxID=1233043 RepID=A0ACC3TM73_9ASCO